MASKKDETHEVRIALLEDRHLRLERSLESLMSKMDQRFEDLTKATQTLNDTLIRAETVKNDVIALNIRVEKIEGVVDKIPTQDFKTETLWGLSKNVIMLIVTAVLIALLATIGLSR